MPPMPAAPHNRPKVVLLANRMRPEIMQVVGEMRAWLTDYAEILAEIEINSHPLPMEYEPDFVIVVGGDGTLISQARKVVDRGIPLVGVNFGRLGFLAEYDSSTLLEHADIVFNSHPPVHEHMMLHGTVRDADGNEVAASPALNDFVLTAGQPFRMIELGIEVDGAQGPPLRGDGMIIATPVGSTAYNVSAGGPIVHPVAEAMIVTPLAPHSLAFRPIVLCADSILRITVNFANAGTTLLIDGQITTPIHTGWTIELRRYETNVKFVGNPSTTFWGILQEKLNWASPPSYYHRPS
jgi:NAD+ kinase